MKIKGSYSLFFLTVIGCSQALAYDFSYKSDIPADNKPSGEYLKKREELGANYWDVNKLAQDNVLAEKREEELREYSQKRDSKTYTEFSSGWNYGKERQILNGLPPQYNRPIGLSYDWNNKKLGFPYQVDGRHFMNEMTRSHRRKCYRETRQKLEKERGNLYSEMEIADSCGG
ncbi:hypothetical protein [Xenorhabdus cabanillasii]|uniref:Lipoprotein n=1 Tax=Xenorhabdus cabanillasii JM26 TaxID=1427517 RepID=W1J7A4_9GAMM|nr:hypothetical protein [Xenorhabdus cabanillasii]PHM76567.1 hypothetical protein Xcab_02866 [Xenorhabdus cabanillasii JM26]CDL86609.1 conserved exported hypothetical protein [Xenorhabdus cabanillasii JM26]